MAHCSPHSLASVRRLAVALDKSGETVEMLLRVVEADMGGRPPLAGGLPKEAVAVRELAAQAACSRGTVKPVLMGRHLLAAGWQAGPAMGEALRAAFQAQLDGVVSSPDDALAWLVARG
jgi:tRNA nucleotidyltransferase (CCA-adding enzyme)